MKVQTVSPLPDIRDLGEPPEGSTVVYRMSNGDIAAFTRRSLDTLWAFPGTHELYPWSQVQSYISFGTLLAVMER